MQLATSFLSFVFGLFVAGLSTSLKPQKNSASFSGFFHSLRHIIETLVSKIGSSKPIEVDSIAQDESLVLTK
jgi:hypothetical protein